jgi:hypothetical protein
MSPTAKPSAVARVVAAVTLCLAVVVAAIAVDIASAARSAKVLGATKGTPSPLCPKNCRATGSVTGFMISADGRRGLYKVPADGHLVAWSVELSKPTSSQLSGFGEIFKDEKFGTAPIAKISVLKKKGEKGSRFTLGKQSPAVELDGSLGGRPIFTLDKPLKVQQGRVVALTLPTWAPLYRDGLNTRENAWKASRKPDSCGAEDVPKAKPHLRKKTTRTYGCKLSGERILYWAYFVPKKTDKPG